MTTLAPRSYAQLLAEDMPRPIRTEEEADGIRRRIDDLVPRPDLSEDEIDYLNLLGMILEAWERDRVELEDPTPQELLRELLAVHGLRQSDLVGPVFPTKGIASEIIHGKRRLTVDYIDRLAAFFHVSPSVFFPSRHEDLLAPDDGQ